MEKILSRPYAERLEALFAQLDELPADLMFTHGPRIPRRPYRWAPLHLLEYKDNYLCIPAPHAKTPMAVRTDKGLRLKCRSFQLSTENEHTPDSTFIHFTTLPTDANGRATLRADIPIEEQQTNYGMSLAATNPRTAHSWRESNTHVLLESRDKEATSNLYLLIGPECMQGPPANLEPGKVCLIVKRDTHREGDGKVIYGSPLDTVVVYKMPGHATVKPGLENNDTFVHWRGIEVAERTFVIG